MKVKTLPEPFVPVFVTFDGEEHIAQLLSNETKLFSLPFHLYQAWIHANTIDSWDYAVPAGDMLL